MYDPYNKKLIMMRYVYNSIKRNHEIRVIRYLQQLNYACW